jgi:hypothetical protein
MIQNLTYELSVLSKSVQHKNLSAAASHVGLSQPQLSRLVVKIERELNVVLLDRAAKRKSSWTTLAHELSMAYVKGIGRLQDEILSLAKDKETEELRIGTLEGLSELALTFCKIAFEKYNIKSIFLDVLDFRDLDSQFLNGQLDAIFTVRFPGKQKFHNYVEVGSQHNDKISTNKRYHVMSSFEYAGADKKTLEQSEKILTSNSLAIRKMWLESNGGFGSLPSQVSSTKGRDQYSVFLLASEAINPKLWSEILKIYT